MAFCHFGASYEHSLLRQAIGVILVVMASNNIKTLEHYSALRRNLSLVISQKIKDLPFGPRQMIMLKVIYTQGGITLGKLAERVGTDPGTVSRSIAQMVELNWVEKTQSAEDGRLWSVRMSEEGAKQMPRIMEIYGDLADSMVSTLSPEELNQLNTLLVKINAHFDKVHGRQS